MESVDLDAVLARCVSAHALSDPAATIEDAVRRPAGVYGAAPTGGLSIAARMRPFRMEDMNEALWSRRSIVRTAAMRGSVYILPRELVPAALAIAAASGGARWLVPALRKGGIGEATVERLAASVESLLHEGPKTAAEIRAGLGWKDPFPQALSLLLRHLSFEGRIVSTRVRGGWKSQVYEYGLLREWIDLPRRRPNLEEAVRTLAPLYFEANGPATRENFAWWAGVKASLARDVIGALNLEPVSVRGLGGDHFATRASLDELASASPAGVTNLLPFWDSYIMAQSDRSRYLEAKWADRVVDRSGNATNVVLRDGRVAGIWDCIQGTLRFATLERVPLGELREAAERFRDLLEFRKVEKVRMPGPLATRGWNAFMSPLRST